MSAWRCRFLAGVCVYGMAAACAGGGSLTAPTTAPSIFCPAPPPITASNVGSAVVTYTAPTTSGGTLPESVLCTPSSGSSIPIGATSVACTVTDAIHRSASCSFTVDVVAPIPHLGLSTILAFGDSITEGEVPVPGEFSRSVHFVEPDKSYPADLVGLTTARYSAQTATRIDAFCTNDPPPPSGSAIVIVNAGCLGEQAEDPATSVRLLDKIAVYHPDLVLLMEGTNDLDESNPSGSIAAGTTGIQNLVQVVRGRNAVAFVATIPPQVASELTHGGSPGLVQPYNAALVPAAIAAGAQIVDVFGDLSTDVPDWISPLDGLHPTEAGYAEIAKVWFAAIEKQFETASTSRLPPTSFRRATSSPGR